MATGSVPFRPRGIARVDGRVCHIDGQLYGDVFAFGNSVVPEGAFADEFVGGEVVEGDGDVGELQGEVGAGCIGCLGSAGPPGGWSRRWIIVRQWRGGV